MTKTWIMSQWESSRAETLSDEKIVKQFVLSGRCFKVNLKASLQFTFASIKKLIEYSLLLHLCSKENYVSTIVISINITGIQKAVQMSVQSCGTVLPSINNYNEFMFFYQRTEVSDIFAGLTGQIIQGVNQRFGEAIVKVVCHFANTVQLWKKKLNVAKIVCYNLFLQH